MKNPLKIKYCPRCKKEVAVVNNGNPKGKHSYKCKVCGRQFSERKYPIEVRCLAVKFRDFGYSYRDIAKIFGIGKTPNNICHWVAKNPEYDIDYKQQIKILREYKEICGKIEVLEQCEKALKYHKLQEEYNSVIEILSTQTIYNSTELRKWTQRNQDICDEIIKLGNVRYKNYSIKKIRTLQNKVNIPIEELKKAKSEMEAQTVLARDTYNMSEIISVLKRLIGND